MLPVDALYSGDSQCGGLERPIVIWIAGAAAWRSQYGRIVSPQMSLPSPPMVDFSREGGIAGCDGDAALGRLRPEPWRAHRRPCGMVCCRAGGLARAAAGLSASAGRDQPCLVLKVPAVPFARITVLDLEGRTRLEGVR